MCLNTVGLNTGTPSAGCMALRTLINIYASNVPIK